MPRRRSLTRPHELLAAERRAYVFQLKQAGGSYTEIYRTISNDARWAGRLPKSYDERHVHGDVKYELQRYRTDLAERVEDVREEELSRINTLLMHYWNRALGEPNKQKPGDLDAARFVITLMERRARYLPGLDAPHKIAPTNPAGDKSWSPPGGGITEEFYGGVAAVLAQYGTFTAPGEDETLEVLPLPTNGTHHNGTNGTVG